MAITDITNISWMGYILNLKKFSCTCGDFTYRGSKNVILTDERQCKHLKNFCLTNIDDIQGYISLGAKIPKCFGGTSKEVKVKPKILLLDIKKLILQKIEPHFLNGKFNLEIHNHSYCGSLRRKLDAGNLMDTAGDIDIIYCGSLSLSELYNRINPQVKLSLGEQSTMFLLDGIHVDIKRVEVISWPFALLRATGSKNHNIALSKIARQKQLKLNEYGLFDIKTNKPVNATFYSEQDIYAYLNLPYHKPSERNFYLKC